MARCETSRLGAIPCLVSCLPQGMLHDNVKIDVSFKKMGEESTRAVELGLEGHISGQKHKRKVSKLLITSLLLAAVSILFKT